MRILIIDDEEMILDTTSKILSKMGHIPCPVKDCDSAMGAVINSLENDQRFDLAIVDLNIDESVGGADLFIKIREIDPSIKGIISSGQTTDREVEKYSEYGFSERILKPYTYSDLSALIEKFKV